MDKLLQIVRHVQLLRDRVEDWGEYPFCIPAVRHLNVLEFAPGITFFVGENGSGKSTLIEAIAINAGFGGEGGAKSFTNSQRPSESVLRSHLRVARGGRREKSGFFLRAETMFNVSTAAEAMRAHGMEDLHEMSHGEAFLSLAMNRFGPHGLYIMDEPEAALSPQRQLAFMGRIHQLLKQGCQFIIATHSPILLAFPGAKIFSFSDAGIEPIRYEDTEHYTVTSTFLRNPARMLDMIFADVDQSEDRA